MEIERQWNVFALAVPGPPLDAREEALDARTVATHSVAVEVVLVKDQMAGAIAHPVPDRIAVVPRVGGDPACVYVLPMDRDQVFRARDPEDENVGIVFIEVLR